jgi:hypothetical protein
MLRICNTARTVGKRILVFLFFYSRESFHLRG